MQNSCMLCMTLAADGAPYPSLHAQAFVICQVSCKKRSYYSVAFDMINTLSLAGLYSPTTTKLSNSGSAYQFEFVQVSKSLSS